MAMRPAPHFVVSQTRQPLLNSVLQILCACCARDFWIRVNRLKHTGKLVSSTIHCCNDNIEIANVLLTSSCVGLDGSQTRLLKQEIDERLSNASLANDCVISSNEVCAAAKYLKCVEMCWTGRSGVEWGVGTGVEMWTGRVFSVESKWCGTSVKM